MVVSDIFLDSFLVQIRLGKKKYSSMPVKCLRRQKWRLGPFDPDHNKNQRLKAPKHNRNQHHTHQR